MTKSPYFNRAKDSDFTCQREVLSEFSDAYHISYTARNIARGLPRDQTVRFVVDSEYNRVFHFFKWSFTSIWDWSGDFPDAFSETSGICTPQAIHESNKNVTTAFKGPVTTHIGIELTPTSYVSEPDEYAYSGYRTYYEGVERGSVVNKRTMLLKTTADGYENKGLDIGFVTQMTNKIYQVRVIRIRSLIEICAFILGSIAGFVFVARVIKNCLGDKEYFRAKD